MSDNKHEKKREALNEKARGKELAMEELEQVTGGDEPIGKNTETGLKGVRIHGIEWNG